MNRLRLLQVVNEAPPFARDPDARVYLDDRRQSLGGSLVCAWAGLRYAAKTQRNLRLQLVIGTLALMTAAVMRLPAHEVALVCALVGLVLFAELMNTALELLLDHEVGAVYHSGVKLIKDVSASAVLVVSLTAGMTGATLFVPAFLRVHWRLISLAGLAWTCGGLSLLALLALWRSHRAGRAVWAGRFRVAAGSLLAGTFLLALVRRLSR